MISAQTAAIHCFIAPLPANPSSSALPLDPCADVCLNSIPESLLQQGCYVSAQIRFPLPSLLASFTKKNQPSQ